MKTNAAIIIIAVLLVLCIGLVVRIQGLQDKNSRYESVIREKTDSIKYHVNENGRVVAEKAAAVVTTHEMMKLYKDEIADIRKDFDIKAKDIKAFVRAEIQAQGSGTATIINNHYVDSTGRQVRAKNFAFSDGYLSFKSTIFDSLTTAFSTYTYSDTLTYVFSTKKKWLLGKEQLYGSGQLSNKNAKITSATNVLVKDYKDKRWVVSAGVSYVPFGEGMKVQPTVSFGYALFKF